MNRRIINRSYAAANVLARSNFCQPKIGIKYGQTGTRRTMNYSYLNKIDVLLPKKMSSSAHRAEQLIFDVGTADDFDEIVMQSTKPVLVSFHADWCGPCQNLEPRLDAKVMGQQGKILLAKINVEEGAEIAERFEINAVPTIMCFKNGGIVHRFEGDVDDAYLDQVMTNLMLKEERLYKNQAGQIVPDEGEEEKIF